MKKDSSFTNRRESSRRETKPMRRESREVMSELVAQLTKQVNAERVVTPGRNEGVDEGETPNLDRIAGNP